MMMCGFDEYLWGWRWTRTFSRRGRRFRGTLNARSLRGRPCGLRLVTVATAAGGKRHDAEGQDAEEEGAGQALVARGAGQGPPPTR
jgi:hypothetical protein